MWEEGTETSLKKSLLRLESLGNTTYKRSNSLHPFQYPPKESKKLVNKAIRVAKITKALEKQDELQLKYRQERANKKRLTGFDAVIQLAIINNLKRK